MYESQLKNQQYLSHSQTTTMKLVLTHAANIPSNKYQHLLLFISLENAPSTSLKLCANSSNKFQHLWLYFSLRNVPRICLELCALFSNKYQHSLLYLSLENVLKVCLGNSALLKCLSQQYGPALMVACCVGFRALDSSWKSCPSSKSEACLSLHLPLLSLLSKLLLGTRALSNSSLGIRASHQKLSSWIMCQMKSHALYLPY